MPGEWDLPMWYTTMHHSCNWHLAIQQVTKRFFDSIDLQVTWRHIITSNWFEGGRLPLVCETDRECLEAACRAAGLRELQKARIVRIKNTLRCGECMVSSALIAEMRGRSDIEIGEAELEMFDQNGTMQVQWT